MFVATAQDGNEQVYPIAFGYGDSENNLSWEWFLDCLKGALGHIDELVFIFGRHASIEAGISKVFPYATNIIYCWHFAENIKKRFHRNMLQQWFHDRYRAAQSMQHQLIDATHLVILKHVENCGFMTVNQVD
ncbi:hypothetical protein Ddye_028692 [Dipteronia dyeriana]|uniref:MULE transposase domain-containing protein n=1 Tax=Dipteronia dyeriana TaxID=168575 RepID=A0AAD9WKX8_9ROSI|nr:hypothetical protein Ddye_028692 [Dipteronia dyeriana]